MVNSRQIADQAKKASISLAKLSTNQKDKALTSIARLIKKNAPAILKENEKDVRAMGETPMTDRVRLSKERIEGICAEIMKVVSLEDPVGKILGITLRPNGLKIVKTSCPMGVILMIYESRPNVTVDASVLSLKSGNAVILKGGKEAINTNRILVKLIKQALKSVKIDENAVQFVDSVEKESINEFLKLKGKIDLVIPRGGRGLIKFISENSLIPVIETGASVVHIYVDKTFDLKTAVSIIVNSKTLRVLFSSVKTILAYLKGYQNIYLLLWVTILFSKCKHE